MSLFISSSFLEGVWKCILERMDDIPDVNILLLGDAECGKSTFLS
jgi:GTPase SAR1 family protein